MMMEIAKEQEDRLFMEVKAASNIISFQGIMKLKNHHNTIKRVKVVQKKPILRFLMMKDQWNSTMK